LGSLACLSANAVQQQDGYIQATVDPQSGKALLGVRQGMGDTTGNSYTITGYYLGVDTTVNTYVIYAVDAAGKVTTLQQGPLTAAPPHPFTFGLLFKGTNLTAYINGQAYTSVTSATYPTGWTAICSDGTSTFSDVRLYNLAG
jgi:hypothetical protein